MLKRVTENKSIMRFAKYTGSSVLSEIIDCLSFFLVMLFGNTALGVYAELVASFVAKVTSCTFNFIINRKLVFKAHEGLKGQTVRFIIFSFLQMLVSAGLIMLINSLLGIENAFTATLVKYAVDLLLFFAGYTVQKKWVFKGMKDGTKKAG